jgi:hypothetical protein
LNNLGVIPGNPGSRFGVLRPGIHENRKFPGSRFAGITAGSQEPESKKHQTPDVFDAATAIMRNATGLVSNDPHFERWV